MKQGLLWYDNDPKKSLEAKLIEAANRYKEKFGSEPTVCYINPTQIEAQRSGYGKVKVVSAARVSPNHLWLEIEK
ncbi:MAG: hypothetical protein A2Z03_06285 [Chloroflexi bacterium RBG_16_56_8]|nr:MAG: hypothetical protein A2Z03_06285 [Chloroflexi bacterium RBG_16_56_8]